MQKLFSTKYGQAIVTFQNLAKDFEGNTLAQYSCRVLTHYGIIQTPSIFLGIDEQLTQEIVEQAASVATSKSRTTNRVKNYQIREFLQNQKFNY